MPDTTVIRNADWLIAWDGARHVYLRDADLAFTGAEIGFVGHRYDGPAETEIDGRALVVMPGFVNIHSHPTSEPLRKGITDETRSPGFWHSSLYEFLTVFQNDRDGNIAAMQVALAELMTSGVTTVADLSMPFDGWLDTMAESGMRCVAAPMFRDARWYTRDGHSLEYDWDEGAGREAFEEAKRVMEMARQHPSGRLGAMVAPAQVDTCSAALLGAAYGYAVERDLPFQIHAAQSITEFHEMTRRHGRSPIQWLGDIGGLGQHTIIGHGIFLDHHPWVHWTTREDIDLLVQSGATVAHCPTVFARRGITLDTFGDYVRAGINMGIGTDTYPHNFLEELRSVGYFARITAGSVDDLDTLDVYNAATVGGAKALRRDDIGRLGVGAKADIVLVDAKHPSMMPLREPIRSLIYVAAERAVRDVYVDGAKVVADGRALNIDLQAASEALEEAQKRSLERVSKLDWDGRGVERLAPMVLPTLDALN